MIPFYNMNDQILLIDELASGTLFMFKLDYSAVQLDLLYSFNSSYFSASPASNFVTFQVLQTSESDICIVLVGKTSRRAPTLKLFLPQSVFVNEGIGKGKTSLPRFTRSQRQRARSPCA